MFAHCGVERGWFELMRPAGHLRVARRNASLKTGCVSIDVSHQLSKIAHRLEGELRDLLRLGSSCDSLLLVASSLANFAPATTTTTLASAATAAVASPTSWLLLLLLVESLLLVVLHAVLLLTFATAASFALFWLLSSWGALVCSSLVVVASLITASIATLTTWGGRLLLTKRSFSEQIKQGLIVVLLELSLELASDVHEMSWIHQGTSI